MTSNMKFPEKLWNMVNDCQSDAISWRNDGKTIFINYTKFESEFLGKESGVFKTKNVVSFIRQLNLYGFRKCSRFNDIHEFKSPFFVRGRKDLLKFLRRKLGYAMNVATSPDEKENTVKLDNKETNQSSEKEETQSKLEPLPGPSRYPSFPFPGIQDLNALPYGWWGNSSYFPLNSLFPMNNVQPRPKDGRLPKIKEENEDSTQMEAKQVNPYWDTLDMYSNVIFVPVPAQYGMYPGFYNESFPFPYPTMWNEDKKTSGTGQD